MSNNIIWGAKATEKGIINRKTANRQCTSPENRTAFAISQRNKTAGKYGKNKCRLLLPGACNPACSCERTRLKTRLSAAIKQQDAPPHNCRLQLYISPITAEQCRVKEQSLRPCRSCFAPVIKQSNLLPPRTLCLQMRPDCFMVEASGTAPESNGFIT